MDATLSPVAQAFYDSNDREAFKTALVTEYGPEVASFVQAEMARVWEDDDECSDSFRFAVKGNAADESRFEEEHTCCGQADFEFAHPSGIAFLYGFNYGH